jgi:ankyrin repeat protein
VIHLENNSVTKLGANVNAKNENGKTPLHLACFWGHMGTVKYLVEHGATLNVTTDKGIKGDKKN